MGDFDSILEPVSCPACGARHDRGWQTKLFEPDYLARPGETFELGGAPVRVHLSVEHFEQRAGREGYDEDWLAFAPWKRETPLVVLASEEQFYCSCGALVVPELCFTLHVAGSHTDVALAGVQAELLSREESLGVVHFCEAVPLLPSPSLSPVERLKTALPAERRLLLAAAYRAEAFWEPDSQPRRPAAFGSDVLSGPMRCRACGDRRTRWVRTSLFQAPEAPLEGCFVAGEPMTVASPSVSSPLYRVLRRGSAPERFGLLEVVESWSCACGAGPVIPLLVFEAGRESATLVEMHALEQVDAETLAQVSFVHAHLLSSLGGR